MSNYYDGVAPQPIQKYLWEILVPKDFSIEHHQVWDEEVREIAGGLTITRSTKGYWTSPKGEVLKERMIPVRIYCDRESFLKIVKYTLVHYDQDAVMGYRISEDVILYSK